MENDCDLLLTDWLLSCDYDSKFPEIVLRKCSCRCKEPLPPCRVGAPSSPRWETACAPGVSFLTRRFTRKLICTRRMTHPLKLTHWNLHIETYTLKHTHWNECIPFIRHTVLPLQIKLKSMVGGLSSEKESVKADFPPSTWFRIGPPE